MNVRGLNDLNRMNDDQVDMHDYWDKIIGKVTSSLAMGMSLGTGALLSFYVLKHYLIGKAQWWLERSIILKKSNRRMIDDVFLSF